jgi:uncharacterized protein (DUF2225 family)
MTKALNGTTNGYQASTMSTRRLDGDAELRKVASAGREWMFKHGRKIDMESEYFLHRSECQLMIVYVYRLAIEWARLNSDDRDAMTYQG